MSIKTFISQSLKSVKKHLFDFSKFTLYMGGPFIILYALGDLIWLINEEYGNVIFFILVIYLYIGVAQNKIARSDFNSPINLIYMLNLWKKITFWPLAKN